MTVYSPFMTLPQIENGTKGNSFVFQHLGSNHINSTGTGSAGEDCLSSDYDDQDDSGQVNIVI